MASGITTTGIDTAYPVAGQDNDSQGFRDNFTNLKTALDTAKTEISDLEAKAVLKSALSGESLSNDGAGAVIEDFEHVISVTSDFYSINIDTHLCEI